MSTIFSRIAGLKRQSVGEYREVVLQAAKGEQIDETDLFGLLTVTGKSIDEFQADVARVAQRFEAATELEEAASLAEQIAEADEKVRRASEEHTRIKAECEAKIDQAFQAFRDARAEQSNLSHRVQEMQRSAKQVLAAGADPQIDAQISDLRRQIEQHRRYLATNVLHADSRSVEGKQAAQRTIDRLEQEIADLNASKLKPENVRI